MSNPPENPTSTDSGLTMEDFEDCIDYGPFRGEVGFTDEENMELLECPCNCIYCLERALTPEEVETYLNR